MDWSPPHRPGLCSRALATVTWLFAAGAAAQTAAQPTHSVLFAEDFERGLDGWAFPFGQGHEVLAEPGTDNAVLALRTVHAPVYALIRGSEEWGDVRIEGRVLFPDDDHNYLGFIYRYRDDGRRIDFGSVYIKGNGSYVQANEHHDTNVGRTVYPELRANLDGPRAIEIGVWQRFALEVVGPAAHLYVGDLTAPVLTLPAAGAGTGAFGFKPRNPGAGVWIDDISVRGIEGFSYDGVPVPDPRYRRADLATDWRVLGPLPAHSMEVETGAEPRPEPNRWTPFPADHRGAVLTGRSTEFRRDLRVAYFRTSVNRARAGEAQLCIATADDLAIWVNGSFIGFAGRQEVAWWDAGVNADHPPLRADVVLREGPNEILVRVTGGTYATGGYYLGVCQ